MVVVDSQTQMTQDAVDQTTGRRDPATLGYQRSLRFQRIGHCGADFGVPIRNPPSGWMVSPVIPRDRSAARNT